VLTHKVDALERSFGRSTEGRDSPRRGIAEHIAGSLLDLAHCTLKALVGPAFAKRVNVNHSTRIRDEVRHVRDPAVGEPLCAPWRSQGVVSGSCDDPAPEPIDLVKGNRSGHRARREDVARGIEHTARRDNHSANLLGDRGRAVDVDVGDEDPYALAGQVAREHTADVPCALNQNTQTV
jgi:hypothetical protein